MFHRNTRIVPFCAVSLALFGSGLSSPQAAQPHASRWQLGPTPLVRAHLTYFGGPVVSKAKVVQVLYGSGTYQTFVTASGSSSMSGMYSGVTNSAYFDWLNEYNTQSQTIGRGTFAGQMT